MKTAGAFTLALSLGSITLLAQGSGRNAAQPAVAEVARVSSGCPIDMQAQRQPGQGTQTFAGSRDQGVAQQVQLTLNNPKYSQVTGLHITVRGLDANARLSPARIAEKSTSIQKSIDLKLKLDPKSQTSTELLLPAFTSVSLIRLDSVRYADGSTWRSSAAHACQVIPDGFMLIAKR